GICDRDGLRRSPRRGCSPKTVPPAVGVLLERATARWSQVVLEFPQCPSHVQSSPHSLRSSLSLPAARRAAPAPPRARAMRRPRLAPPLGRPAQRILGP